jgi:hypothetical protein
MAFEGAQSQSAVAKVIATVSAENDDFRAAPSGNPSSRGYRIGPGESTPVGFSALYFKIVITVPPIDSVQ